MRYRQPVTVPVVIDRAAPTPLRDQISAQLREAIDGGALRGGARMPSTRVLARVLGVSRGVTLEAYDDLLRTGHAEGRRGSGTYVARRSTWPAGVPVRRPAVVDLRPGRPHPEALGGPARRAAWRWATEHEPTVAPPLGTPELRAAVATHLLHTRGVRPDRHEVLVTAGAAHGLRLVLAALSATGAAVAIEEPTPAGLWSAGGGRPTPIPVDDGGARLDRLAVGCRAAVVLADACVPYGQTMTLRRRLETVVAAARAGAHLVEVTGPAAWSGDDRPPHLVSLAAPGGASLVGGFGPAAAGLGYAVVPRPLAAAVARRLAVERVQPPAVAQLAAAFLLRDGAAERAARRLGALHERLRRTAADCLAGVPHRLGAPGTVVVPVSRDAGRVADGLRPRGILVRTLTPYHFSAVAPAALVIGYGHLSEVELRAGLTALVPCVT